MTRTPLYLNIRNYILKQIEQGTIKDGEKIPTDDELMKKFSVSKGTVQKAVFELVKDGYLIRRQGSGTYVADREKTQLKKNICLLIPWPATSEGIQAKIFEGAEQACMERGFHLTPCLTHDSFEYTMRRLSSLLENDRTDGIVLYPLESAESEKNDRILEIAKINDVHIVIVDHLWEGANIEDIPYITSDNYTASYELTKTLIEAGNKRIAYLRCQGVSTSIERWRGYQDALKEANLPLREEYQLIVAERNVHRQGIQETDVLLAMSEVPDVIMCAHDIIAKNVLMRLKEKGVSVPEKIKVAGFDDLDFSAYLNPPITTVRQQAFQMGYQATNFLIDKILGKLTSAPRVTLRCQVILRASTGHRINNEYPELTKERGISATVADSISKV